ncbi:hypothetical protein GPECTOR_13g751 [Gonium pectorale]|uniref:Uncharacterized protein n=1 Tax=Gonium pectorale TaxID=33097 RepID=A0A150GN88_GONPE|nr:hypothetical protein GPECTOR_13g751 [Gonium pectorale]|eukprot:KXZ51264.1 hypothetical protein GPECTOR_13g751 [Gonium pectorale]
MSDSRCLPSTPSKTAQTAFVNDFKKRVSDTWTIPFDKAVVKSINFNGVMRSLQRRRTASEVEEPAPEVIEVRDSWRQPLRALQELGLTRIVQARAWANQVTTPELLQAHRRMEAQMLGLLSVHCSDLNKHTSANHRILAGSDSTEMDFSVTQQVEVPLPPSPPPRPRPPNPPGIEDPAEAPPPPNRPPRPPSGAPINLNSFAVATGASVTQENV